MKIDVARMADRLARDPRITDYDFWRAMKNLDNEIFDIANSNEPIPIRILRWREIVRRARDARRAS